MSSHSHEILVVKKHDTGAEEWFCPTCGRRFIVQWAPEYQCIILNVGDEIAIHNIGRGALVVLNHSIEANDSSLAPFADWISQLDIDGQLDEDSQ